MGKRVVNGTRGGREETFWEREMWRRRGEGEEEHGRGKELNGWDRWSSHPPDPEHHVGLRGYLPTQMKSLSSKEAVVDAWGMPWQPFGTAAALLSRHLRSGLPTRD